MKMKGMRPFGRGMPGMMRSCYGSLSALLFPNGKCRERPDLAIMMGLQIGGYGSGYVKDRRFRQNHDIRRGQVREILRRGTPDR